MVPVFTLHLNQKVLTGRITTGKYNGTNSCLTAATTADKIFIHSPHQHMGFASGRIRASDSNKDISLLNVNQAITSVRAGPLNPKEERDVLLVGTLTNLLAYDVDNNSDLFYKEVADGANVLTIGKLGSIQNPLVIVGGNCSLVGFDFEGDDPFWTVTGDNVCSVALVDFDLDGENELIVGSEDYDIRIFKEDDMISEITETEAVTALTPVGSNKFGYALANGTVGVYEKMQRWWRIKSKNQAVTIHSFDIDGDGVEELITGWTNGKVDARHNRTGEVIFKDNFNHSVAGIVEGDYQLSGKNDIICCSVEGEVRGYHPSKTDTHRNLVEINVEQETIHDLCQRKQNLLFELKNYEGNSKFGICDTTGTMASLMQDDMGVIPAHTQLQTGLTINMADGSKSPHVEIALSTNNDTIIRAVLIFAEGIFDGESHVIHPKDAQLSSEVHVPIYPPKDIPVDLHIKAFVGYKGAQHYHVFELTRQLPRFSMYAVCKEPSKKSKGSVSFTVNERVQRIALWINQNFLLMSDLEVVSDLNITFLSLKSNMEVTITMEANGNIVIATDDMDLAGDLIQCLAVFLNVEDLQVNADFPDEQEKLTTLLQQVVELQDVRFRLASEMADHSGLIRSLVVRAEDSRLMEDIKNMRKWYMQLFEINKDIFTSYKIRCTNHQELLESLRNVNQIIQKAARLRVGKSKTNVINLCRAAIKNNNINSLIKIIRTGEA